ncbi:DUF4214 domain-containing protein [Achromobacter sp. GG226]|uniref:DUF4214 domain-containing protein n=1 Tax=Verticiella alkaliphila TaxID=2779529 RepID=UPI001C0D07CC|nr:DUF4214 domain-containing protein [Verticiella sp. GG226]MBU4611584.1 DUF4214 domain-containing protein [Verticiella sp. GG226]
MASVSVEQAREDVASLFLSYMKRAPEFQAMSYYVGVYNQLLADQGEDPAAQQNAFKALAATIYTDASGFGEVPTGPAFSNDQYVDWIYENALGREADAAGREYWIAQLDSGSIERPALVGIILRAAESDERDAAYVANRTEVALEFAKFENSNPNLLPNLEFNAAQVLEGVTDDPASVDAALQKLYATTGGGESFTLTPGTDNLTGTSGDDVFNATPVDPTNSQPADTLNQFDTVDGGLGRDTLNIYTDGAGKNSVQQGTVRNVEVINIYNTDEETDGALFGLKDGTGVNAAGFQGAEEVWQYNRADTVNNLGANTAAGFGNLTAAETLTVNAAAATATVAFDNVVANDEGSVDLSVAGGSLNQVTIAGELAAVEDGEDAPYVSLTVNNSGTGNVGTFTLNSAVDARIESIDGNGVTAVNAAGSTGDIWYEMGDGVKSFTGGSGDDRIVFEDRALSLSDSVDGGEGTDTVVLSTGGQYQTQDYLALGNVSNVEQLAFKGAEVSVDAAQLTGFDSLWFEGSGTATVQNLADGQAIYVAQYDNGDDAATNPETLVLSNAAGAVNLNVDLPGAVEESEDTPAQAEVTLNLEVDAAAVGAEDGTLTVTGESGRLSLNNDIGGKFSTIDVSDFAGNLTVGLATDVAETVTLGSGSAAIYLDYGSSTVGALDTIENFKVESDSGLVDQLYFEDDAEGATLADHTLASGVSTLDQAWADAAAAYANEGFDADVLVFTFQGDTYLYADANSDGRFDNEDFGLKLAGEFTAEQLQQDAPEQPTDLQLV